MGIHQREPKRTTLCARCFCEQTACTKAIAVELINVSGLYNLNELKVEELLYLLVFIWSPRSERWLALHYI